MPVPISQPRRLPLVPERLPDRRGRSSRESRKASPSRCTASSDPRGCSGHLQGLAVGLRCPQQSGRGGASPADGGSAQQGRAGTGGCRSAHPAALRQGAARPCSGFSSLGAGDASLQVDEGAGFQTGTAGSVRRRRLRVSRGPPSAPRRPQDPGPGSSWCFCLPGLKYCPPALPVVRDIPTSPAACSDDTPSQPVT